MILRVAGRDATADYDAIHAPELISETLPSSAYKGEVDVSTIAPPPSSAGTTKAAMQQSGPPPLTSILNLRDFEAVAERFLPPHAWAYYTAGADDEITKAENEGAYRKVLFRPRMLRNVGTIDTRTKILGFDSTLPFYITAVGIAKFAHPGGECTLVKAAGEQGIPQLVATRPSMAIESIMEARVHQNQPVFFQLYMHKDDKQSEAIIKRAVKAGVHAIWLTVDSPVVGKRERDERLKGQVDVGFRI